MRIAFVVLAAVSCLATPAVAQDREPQIVERLNDPLVQEGVAVAVSALAGMVLDTNVGSLARYSDGRIRPGDTLRDVQRRDDPDFERRLYRDARRTVGTAGVVASDLSTAMAAFAETAARLRTVISPLAEAGDTTAPLDWDD